MAIKAGDLPLPHFAPNWFASPIWGYVPLVAITFAFAKMIFWPNQNLQAVDEVSANSIKKTTKNAFRPQQPNPPVGQDILPKNVTEEYLKIGESRATDLKKFAFLKQYKNKWMYFNLELHGFSQRNKCIRGSFIYRTGGYENLFIFANFDNVWSDQLHQIKPGEIFAFRTKVEVDESGAVSFEVAEPIIP